MKKLLIYSFGLLALTACREEEPEILDFSDIVATSDRYGEDSLQVNDSNPEDTLAYLLKGLKESGISATSVDPVLELTFPDRFGPKRAKKFQFAVAGDTIRYSEWYYGDSTRVMNALYNWIDCFGPKCKSVYMKERVNMQPKPFKMLVGDTTLVFIEAETSLDFEQWDDYMESLGYGKDWNLVIEQVKGSRARWYTYKEEQKTLLEK